MKRGHAMPNGVIGEESSKGWLRLLLCRFEESPHLVAGRTGWYDVGGETLCSVEASVGEHPIQLFAGRPYEGTLLSHFLKAPRLAHDGDFSIVGSAGAEPYVRRSAHYGLSFNSRRIWLAAVSIS